MRKPLYSLIALTSLSFATANCSKDDDPSGDGDGESMGDGDGDGEGDGDGDGDGTGGTPGNTGGTDPGGANAGGMGGGPSSCTDGLNNGDEVLVDCGGSCSRCTSVFETDDDTLAIFEFNGDLLDSSGNDRHASSNSTPSFVNSDWGQALELHGNDNQGISWDYPALLSHPFTIEIVLTPRDVDSYGRLFAANDDDYGWYIYEGGSYVYDAGNAVGNIKADKQVHLAYVATGVDAVTLYINGIKVGQKTTDTSAPGSIAEFFEDDGSSEELDGRVEAMRLSSVARTPGEMRAIAAALLAAGTPLGLGGSAGSTGL